MNDEAGTDRPVSMRDEVGDADTAYSGIVKEKPSLYPLPDGACETLMAQCGKSFRMSVDVRMVKMVAPFAVETINGIIEGKSGDWLAENVELGEYMVVSDAVKQEFYFSPRKRSVKKPKDAIGGYKA